MLEGEGLDHDGGKLLDEYQNDGIGQQPAEVFYARQRLVHNIVGFAAVEGYHQIRAYKHHQRTRGGVDAVSDIEHVDEETCSKGNEVLNPTWNLEGQHQQSQKENVYADTTEEMGITEHKNLCEYNKQKAQYVGADVIHP